MGKVLSHNWRSREHELDQLFEILVREKICEHGPEFRVANRKISSVEKDNPISFNYRLQDLHFPRLGLDKKEKQTVQHVYPKAASGCPLDLKLSLEMTEAPPNENLVDPISELNIVMVIQARNNSQNESPPFRCAWHLDRDEQGQASSFVHPLYHFQYGDRELFGELEDESFGRMLHLNTPRFPHPPLDPILCVDFILSHFHGNQWRELHENNHIYQNLVIKAQNRYWAPYFLHLSGFWPKGDHPEPQNSYAKKLWPHLIIA